jgi:phosphoglycolate phosphatase-like HAD superfamily hydrolase
MIGDSNHDVNAGIAARTKTVWLSHGRREVFRRRAVADGARPGGIAGLAPTGGVPQGV